MNSSYANEKAAQLWCLPQHSNKVIDPEFAESIAAAIDAARASGLREAAELARAKIDEHRWNAELDSDLRCVRLVVRDFILARADAVEKGEA